MPKRSTDVCMPVSEFSRRSGMYEETIRDQMRRGVFPLGFAVKNGRGGYYHHIPREPAEYYLRTGKLPD